METAVFEVFDTTLAATEPELLGLWATKSGSDEATAFAVNSLTTSNAPLWRVNLPVDPSLASTYLENSQARLNESQTALGIASERINLLVTKINAEGEANRAFDLFSATRELAQPEQELLVTLLEIRQIGLTASLNWHEELVGNLKQAAQKFQGLTIFEFKIQNSKFKHVE